MALECFGDDDEYILSSIPLDFFIHTHFGGNQVQRVTVCLWSALNCTVQFSDLKSINDDAAVL